MRVFLRTCVNDISRRKRFLAVLNLLFFWTVFAFALASYFLVTPPPYEAGVGWTPEFLFGDSWLLMVLGIFLFNLVLSAFIIVTLPGLVFFVLSPALLMYRAMIWGELLAFTPAVQFVAALPTLILEAEAYVLAAMAGTVLGLSWLKPEWGYRGERLSRREALKRAFKETWHVYFFVALILFAAAIVETVTIFLLL